MKPIRFTVIAGGNSDPPPLADASHLKLVDAPPQPSRTAEFVDQSLLLKFADALIGLVERISTPLESFHKNLKRRPAVTEGDPKKTVVAGRLEW